MVYQVNMNFDKDFVENLIAELADHNINMDLSDDSEKVKINFFNFKKRLITPAPRQVLKSKEFTCSTDQNEGLKLVEDKIIKGEDLLPHLSRQLTNLNYNDSLLNDWGIYHLHLGTIIEPDNFINRTGPVLFARFDNDKAYLINVMGHGSWTKQQMIKVLHDNWPESIDMYRLKGVIGLSHVPTDDDVKAARKFGVNTSIQLEPGVVFTNIGGGYTTSKKSIEVMQTMIYYNKVIEQLEQYVRDNAEKMGEQLKEEYAFTGTKLTFKLAIENGEYFAIEQNTNVAFSLGRH
jgi:hypothetical protein